VFEDRNNPVYWQALVSELMKHIPLVPPVNPPKEHKLVDRIVWHNPRTYGESYDPVELKEWIRGMEKIFSMNKVPRREEGEQ